MRFIRKEQFGFYNDVVRCTGGCCCIDTTSTEPDLVPQVSRRSGDDPPLPELVGKDEGSAHHCLLPYLTITRQRTGSPPEIRPLILIAFTVRIQHWPLDETASVTNTKNHNAVSFQPAQIDTCFSIASSKIRAANGILSGSSLNAVHDTVCDKNTQNSSYIIPQYTGVAVFGLASIELDFARALKCALSIGNAMSAAQMGTSSTSMQVSIAVDYGDIWLGRIGHKYRHQVCVLGSPVSWVASVATAAHETARAKGLWPKTAGFRSGTSQIHVSDKFKAQLVEPNDFKFSSRSYDVGSVDQPSWRLLASSK